jgi:hypothetical protein
MSQPKTLRIAMNGVTGRMGYRQHLVRSILPLRDDGGVELPDGSRVGISRSWSGATPTGSAGSPTRTASPSGPPMSTR